MSKRAIKALALVFAIFVLYGDRTALAANLRASALVDVPAAADSLGPRLTRGDDGILVLSWLEPNPDGYALRYSRWSAAGWLSPNTVANGSNWFVNWADFPSVVPITESFWVAHWLVRREAGGYAYDIYVALSNDSGASWGASVPLHDDNTDTEHGFVSIFPGTNGADVVWLDGRNTIEPNGGMTLRAVTLLPDGTREDEQQIDDFICDCCQTDALLTESGPLVVYRDRSHEEVRDIYMARRTKNQWTPGVPIASDNWEINGCPVNGPALATNGSETAVAWFTAANDQPLVRLARNDATSDLFDDPVDVIRANTVGRVGVVLLDDGTAIVSAITKKKGRKGRLSLVLVDRNGQQRKPFFVTDDVYPFSVPQLVRHGDSVISAWTINEDGETSVRSARIPLTRLGYKSVE